VDAVGPVGDRAVAGQLVGLLAVLAAALAVALPGQAAVAGVGPAGQAERERDVDPGQHGGGALGMLLGTAGGEHHRLAGAAQQRGQLPHLPGFDPGDPLHPLGPPRGRAAPYLLEPGGPGRHIRLVDRGGRVQQMEYAERQRQVGPRHRLQEQVGSLGGRGAARVDHHQPAAPLAEPVEVARGRRHRLGQVGADQDQHVGPLDVGERERQPAVDPERLVGRARRRGHAPAAVVVDLAGAQRHPGELAEQVGLLVGQTTAAEDGVGVGSMLGAQRRQPAGDPVQRVVPTHRCQLAGGPVADQRRGEPLSRAAQPGRCPALAAQCAVVDREGPCGDLQRETTPGQRHPALEAAVGAVRVGHQIRASASVVAAARRGRR
jgi:hypothetical protein